MELTILLYINLSLRDSFNHKQFVADLKNQSSILVPFFSKIYVNVVILKTKYTFIPFHLHPLDELSLTVKYLTSQTYLQLLSVCP